MPSSPHQILYLSPSVRMLGARQSLLQLTRGLDPERYRPHVVVPEPGGLTDALDQYGIPWTALRLRPWRKARAWPFIPGTVRRLRRLADEIGAALVHGNEIYVTPYAVRGAGGRPVVAHVRLERTASFARKYHAHRANAVVCVSDAVADLLRAPESGIAADKFHVIHNGLDLDAFAQAAARTAPGVAKPLEDIQSLIQSAARGDRPPFVLGQFGLLSDRKRHRDVLDALALLKRSDEGNAPHLPGPARLLYLVLGDVGPRDLEADWEHPREHARRLGLLLDASRPEWPEGLRAAAVFLPFQEAVAPFYRLVDAVILPSDREGFGRVIIEAAALGKPALGSRAGGIGEVIEAGETGLLFEVGAVDQIAAAIAELGADPDRARRMGNAARRRAEERFSLRAHVDRVQALYDRLLAQRGTASS